MSKSNQSEKRKIIRIERLQPLSAQLLEEVVGGQAHIASATGGAGAGK